MDMRDDVIDDLEAEIASYFPQDELKNFRIFDPKNFPKSKPDAETYGQDDIFKVAKFMDYNIYGQAEVANEWKILVKQIMNDPEFWQVREAEPNYFWFFYLNDNIVKFHDQIKAVLVHALCLAQTSSDAERAFSVMAHLKTKNRSSLSDEMLNALMWFKMNVASSVEEWPALDYSKKWKAANYLLVDEPGNPQKKQRLDEFLVDDEFDVRRNEKILSGKSSRF